MRPPAPWLPFILLSTMLLPLASADGSHEAEPTTTVWDEPREFWGETYVVGPGERLVIRGTTVTFEASTLRIETGGELIVESTPERSAVLRGLNQSWVTKMYGDAHLLGLPGKPVILDGIGGIGGFQPGAPVANYRDGFTIAVGNFTARHVEVVNYTSGLFAGGNATVALSHVRFASPYGAGLLMSTVHANVSNARFEGPGANMYLTLTLSEATIRNVSMNGTQRGVILRDSMVRLEDVRVDDSGICLEVAGGRRVNVSVEGLRCHGFTSVGVVLHRIQGTTSGNSTVHLAGLDLQSAATKGNAVAASSFANLTIRDSVIGPLPDDVAAIAAEGALPRMDNVTFRDVGGWNVYLIAPGEAPAGRFGEGASGKEGWQLVTDYAEVKVVGAKGSEDGHAHVRFYRESNGTLAAERVITADAKRLLFEVQRIDASDSTLEETYRVVAEDEAGRSVEIRGFDPKLGTLVIDMTQARGTISGLAWALAGVALAAVLARRLRRD